MKLVFITNFNDKTSFGGGDYYIYKLAESLSANNHSVTLFWDEFKSIKPKSSSLIRKRKFSIPEKFIFSTRINKYIKKLYNYFFLESYLKKNSNKIDYIIGSQVNTAIDSSYYGNKYGIKVANFIFETPELLSNSEDFVSYLNNDKWLNHWDKFRKSLIASDLIFGISHLSIESGEKWVGKEINGPIFPGIDDNLLPNIDKQKNQIIYIGRLAKSKNIDKIFYALSSIKNPPKLIICGGGSEKSKLVTLSKKLQINVDFRGIVTDDEKWFLLSQSKFMVFPTSFEGFGMPPMEALYSGIPCIATDLPILKSVYRDKLEFFNLDDKENLSLKIKYLLDNPKYCRKRGIEGRTFVEKNFLWNNSAKNLEKILKN